MTPPRSADDDERLMTLRGELLQALQRGLDDGCQSVDAIACMASAFAELMADLGCRDLTPTLALFAGAARGCMPDAIRTAERLAGGREQAAQAAQTYVAGAPRARRRR